MGRNDTILIFSVLMAIGAGMTFDIVADFGGGALGRASVGGVLRCGPIGCGDDRIGA